MELIDDVKELFMETAKSLWNWDITASRSCCAPPSSLLLLGAPQTGPAPAQGCEPPIIGGTWKAGCYSGKDFVLAPNGTVCCPAGNSLFPQERRQERSGSLRIVYEARIADCRACEQRPRCQWHGQENQHPRRVSVLLHPCKSGSDPVLWRDWPRRTQRCACMQVLHRQRVEVTKLAAAQPSPPRRLLCSHEASVPVIAYPGTIASLAMPAIRPLPSFSSDCLPWKNGSWISRMFSLLCGTINFSRIPKREEVWK